MGKTRRNETRISGRMARTLTEISVFMLGKNSSDYSYASLSAFVRKRVRECVCVCMRVCVCVLVCVCV